MLAAPVQGPHTHLRFSRRQHLPLLLLLGRLRGSCFGANLLFSRLRSSRSTSAPLPFSRRRSSCFGANLLFSRVRSSHSSSTGLPFSLRDSQDSSQVFCLCEPTERSAACSETLVLIANAATWCQQPWIQCTVYGSGHEDMS